jgi:hypothetical protein
VGPPLGAGFHFAGVNLFRVPDGLAWHVRRLKSGGADDFHSIVCLSANASALPWATFLPVQARCGCSNMRCMPYSHHVLVFLTRLIPSQHLASLNSPSKLTSQSHAAPNLSYLSCLQRSEIDCAAGSTSTDWLMSGPLLVYMVLHAREPDSLILHPASLLLVACKVRGQIWHRTIGPPW